MKRKNEIFFTGGFVNNRPTERYVVIGKKEPWIIRMLFYPHCQWDIVGIKKVKE